MQVIALCSQKGGSGKTTLAGHLAVQAELAGAGPVALVDCDPQGSLAAWWNSRRAGEPAFAQIGLATISHDLEGLRSRGFRYVFVDTPPAASAAIVRVMLHADLIVIPTRPSPHDLRAVRATLDLAEKTEKSLVFVVNGAAPRSRLTTDAAVALSQYGTVAPPMIGQRTVMASAMIDGRTVMETNPESQAASEVVELWAYLEQRLQRLANRSAFLSRRGLPTSFGRREVSEFAGDYAGHAAEVA
jgi:chromosome partitioning protein